jgi:uncharacterized protein (DUF58 family)
VRSVFALLALAGLLYLLGAAQGWPLLHTLAYALILTVVLSWVWSRAAVRELYSRPRPRTLRAQVGRFLEERLELENLSWLPKPWLELIDGGDYPDHNLSQVVTLGPLERRARPYRALCRQRGAFQLGPLSVAGGDPLGLFRHERLLAPACNLLVLPATVDLPTFGRLPGDLSGGALQGERVLFATPNVSSVREYQPGDAVKHVHWPTTARVGKLMVKEFERDPLADLTLLVDLDRLVQTGSGADSTEETVVTVAASLARHFLLTERAVRILVQGDELPLDRGAQHLLRSLEFLAVVRPKRSESVGELLVANATRFGRRDALVVVTPSTESGWIETCRDLRQRGVYTSIALIRASDFGPAPSTEAVIAASSAANLDVYLIDRSSPLGAALAAPMTRDGR